MDTNYLGISISFHCTFKNNFSNMSDLLLDSTDVDKSCVALNLPSNVRLVTGVHTPGVEWAEHSNVPLQVL